MSKYSLHPSLANLGSSLPSELANLSIVLCRTVTPQSEAKHADRLSGSRRQLLKTQSATDGRNIRSPCQERPEITSCVKPRNTDLLPSCAHTPRLPALNMFHTESRVVSLSKPQLIDICFILKAEETHRAKSLKKVLYISLTAQGVKKKPSYMLCFLVTSYLRLDKLKEKIQKKKNTQSKYQEELQHKAHVIKKHTFSGPTCI